MTDLGKVKRNQEVDISTGYMFFCPSVQAAGNMVDRSGNNNDGTKTVADSVLWATAGWASFRTQNVADETVAFATSYFDFDFANGESAVISFWMLKAAIEQYHMPLQNARAAGDVGIKVQTDNLLGTYFIGFYSGGTSFNTAYSAINIADNVPHLISVCLDAAAETVDVYIDAALDVNLQGVDISAWKTQGTPAGTKGTKPLLIGGHEVATFESKIRGVHTLKRTGGLPSDIQQVINKIYSRPFAPLSVSDWA